MDQFKVWFADKMKDMLDRDYLTSSDLFVIAAVFVLAFVLILVLSLGALHFRAGKRSDLNHDKNPDTL